jgi:hypothetical protein
MGRTTMTDYETAQQVIDLLAKRGIPAFWEHPGFIRIDLGEHRDLNVGTVNGEWGYDISDWEGNSWGQHDDVGPLPLGTMPGKIVYMILNAIDAENNK